MTTHQLLAFLMLGIPLLAVFAYFGWMVRLGLQKQWRKLAAMVAIPLVPIALFLLFLVVQSQREYTKYLTSVFDTSVTLPKPVYEYNSERSFTGDGFSISVYVLPESIRQRFQVVDRRLLGEYPRILQKRNLEKTIYWRQSPFDPSLESYLDFALSRYDAEKAKGLEDQFAAIRAALAKPGSFYGMLYKDAQRRVYRIDLFIVDLENNRLYLVNSKT